MTEGALNWLMGAMIAVSCVVLDGPMHANASYDWSNHPEVKRTGVGPDEPILIRSNGALFKVPAAYLELWPSRDMVGRTNVADSNEKNEGGFNIIFWVQDRTPYPLKWWPSRIVYDEIDRNGQKELMFNVLAQGIRFQKPENYISPTKQFENVKEVSKGNEYYETRDGLMFFSFPFSPGWTDEGYRHLEGEQPQLLFRCPGRDEPPRDSICQGDVHYTDIDLAFFVRFSRAALPKWKESVTAIRELALKWRVPSPQ